MLKSVLHTFVSILLLLSPIQGQVCYSGYLPEDSIQTLANNCRSSSCVQTSNQSFTYFFDHLTISCNGTLANWTAAGKLVLGKLDTRPTLIVWRPSPSNPHEYLALHRIPLLYCNGDLIFPNSSQVYTCELQQGLPVQAGDVLGMEIPYYSNEHHRFLPFLDESSRNLPQIHFIRGTTLQNYLTSPDQTTRLLPLFSVDIKQDDIDQDQNMTDYPDANTTAVMTTVNNANGSIDIWNIQLGFWMLIGISGGVLILTLSLLTLVLALCCVLLKIRKSRKQEIRQDQDRVEDEVYNSEPYAIVDMSTIEMDAAVTDSISGIPHQRSNRISLTRNPSYAVNISVSPNTKEEGSTHMNFKKDSRLGINLNSRTREETTPTKEQDSTLMASPDRGRHSYQSISLGTAVGVEEDNYVNTEGMRRVDEIDSGIHSCHHPYSQDYRRTLYDEEDASEHTYY